MSDRFSGLRLVPLVLALSGGTAVAETKISADVNVDGGYASNPLLRVGGNTDSATLTANFHPTIRFESATNEFSLSGNVGRTIYSRDFGDNENYSVQGGFRQQLSPRSSFRLGGGFSQTMQNALQPALSPIAGEDSGVNILDPSAAENLGLTTRTLNGSGSFTTALSSRNSLSVQAFGARVTYPDRGSLAQDYDNYGGGLNISHTLNDRISIGAGANYARSDYDNSLYGSSSQISPTLNVGIRFPSRLRLGLNGGVTFSRINQAGLSSNRTAFSGGVNLCRDGDRSTLCIDARRSVSPTAFSGLSNVTSAGLSYSYKLTPRSSIGADVSYSKTSRLSETTSQNTSYMTASTRYSRQMTQRLSFVTRIGYTDSFESIVARKANIYGSIGISYRLGRGS